MKVILLTDVPKVGNRYEVKDLSQGYAQNVLLAKGLAVLATPHELAKVENRKKEIEKKKQEEAKAFEELISVVSSHPVVIKVKANEKGHLFKSVNKRDVIDAVKNTKGVIVDEDHLVMDHIKELGSHKVILRRGDKKGECEILVEAQ